MSGTNSLAAAALVSHLANIHFDSMSYNVTEDVVKALLGVENLSDGFCCQMFPAYPCRVAAVNIDLYGI